MSRPITPHPVNPSRPRPLPAPRPNPPRPQPRPGRVAYVALVAALSLTTGAVAFALSWLAGGEWSA